ncbi:MAG: hypothetical protein AB1798_17980, partial [Spirochaetota bacterium]
MRISVSVLCGLLFVVASLTAQAPPMTILSNAELFSRQYAQADTVIEAKASQGFSVQDQNFMPRKRRLKKTSIFKTTLGSAVCGAGGAFVGMGAALGLIVLAGGTGTGGSDLDGLSEAVGITIFSGTLGATLGCSGGTYLVGKHYRKGKYWHALAGTVLPVLTVAGVTALFSNSPRFNENPTLITFALAPITSTAAYYIFSEELP